MRNLLKTCVAASTVLAFTLAPMVIETSYESAYAQSGNSNGNGNGNANGGGNGNANGNSNGNSNSASASSSGGNGNSGSARSGNASAVAKLNGLFKGPLHPSNLGPLRGAIRSSANAKLVHIKKGNFKGPVGLAAALALADYRVETLNEANATLALGAAYDVIENPPTEEDVATAQAVDAGTSTDMDPLVAAAILSYPDRLAEAEALVREAEASGQTRPTEEELAAAQAIADQGDQILADQQTAETNVLGAYKGSLGEGDETEVLNAVRGENFPTTEQVAQTQS